MAPLLCCIVLRIINIVWLNYVVICFILTTGYGYSSLITGENKSTYIPIPKGIRTVGEHIFLT